MRPDGFVAVDLLLYRVGVLLLTEDTRKRFFDASEAWRNGAYKRRLPQRHAGALIALGGPDDLLTEG